MRVSVGVLVCLLLLVVSCWSFCAEETATLSSSNETALEKLPTVSPKLPSETKLVLPELSNLVLAADRAAVPGTIRRLPDAAGAIAPWFVRPRAASLHSFCIGRWLWDPPAARRRILYYCDSNDRRIFFSVGPGHEAVLGVHRTLVREVCFGPGNQLYFSEASGAQADGKVFRIVPGAGVVLYATVSIGRIGGFWSGNFGFDRSGMMYVSNGNLAASALWRYPIGAMPVPLFRHPNLSGFFVRQGAEAMRGVFFSDLTNVVNYRVIGGAGAPAHYPGPARCEFCDVWVPS